MTATYETVFRIMNEMMEDKAIQMDGKHILILAENKLLEYKRLKSAFSLSEFTGKRGSPNHPG